MGVSWSLHGERAMEMGYVTFSEQHVFVGAWRAVEIDVGQVWKVKR